MSFLDLMNYNQTLTRFRFHQQSYSHLPTPPPPPVLVFPIIIKTGLFETELFSKMNQREIRCFVSDILA